MIGSGKLLNKFETYENKIYNYCRDRIDATFDHKCYTILKNRIRRLDNSIDMKSESKKNTWNSKLAIPYGHESYLMTRATLRQNFNADPLLSLEPSGDTTWENSRDAQEVLNQNLKSIRFRDLAFTKIIKSTSRWGSCPFISEFQHKPLTYKKTVNGQFGYEQQMFSEQKQNVINIPIHPLNYIQNPDIADPESSDYRGYIDRWTIAKLMSIAKSMPDLYVKKNINKVIKEAIKSSKENSNYYSPESKKDSIDFQAHYVDVTMLYTMLNIEGNEEDETIYYVEIIGDTIIRIQDNPNDYNMVPLGVFGLDKRSEYWWANTPIEKTFPMENYANMLLGMTADNIFRASQNYLFYPRGAVDASAINDRHKNGGFIPIDPEVMQSYKTPFQPWQRQELSTNAVQYMMGEVKEALQRTQSKPDTQRAGVSGGPRNDTATAYQGMQADSSMLQYDYLAEFSAGLKEMGRINTIMLQQNLNDMFQVRPNPKEPARILQKENILGEFAYQAETSLTKNTQVELMKYQNALSWMMNMLGTGNPAFQRTNIDKVYRAVLKKFDLDIDIDEIYPEQPAGMEVQQAMPQLPQPQAQGIM